MKLLLYLTWSCGENCEFCNLKRQACNEIPVEEWKEIVRAVDPEFVILFGGDPLLYEGWAELCEWLSEEEIPFTVFCATRLTKASMPITVSVDTPGDRRSDFGMYASGALDDVVVNVQIYKDNVDWALRYLGDLDRWGVPWLVDLHHGGLMQNGESYLLRSSSKYQCLDPGQIDRVEKFLTKDHPMSLEPPEVYKAVCDAARDKWYCRPEESIGYLTVAPDGTLMACVDLKLYFPLYAKDWPENRSAYIAGRMRARDRLCNGCYWRHEISARMFAEDAGWSKEDMMARKGEKE